MAGSTDDTQLPQIVEHFRAGAIGYHLGVFLQEGDMQTRALELMTHAMEGFRRLGEEGHQTLVALMSDHDDNVRVMAAQYLLDEMPDQAIPVLEDVHDHSDSIDASRTAYYVLKNYREGYPA